jgi:hypothetical protein
MCNLNEPPTSLKRGWSSWPVVRKAQIIGAIAAGLLTTGIVVLCVLFQPKVMSILGFLGDAVAIPAIFIVSLFGVPANWFDNERTGGPAIFPLCLIVAFNTLLGGLIGAVMGQLLKFIKKKRK